MSAAFLQVLTRDREVAGLAGGAVDSALYDAQDRLLSYGHMATGYQRYSYTKNGELTQVVSPGGTSTYTYDELGNLIGAQPAGGASLTYLIDGQNRRVGKKRNGTLEKIWLYQNGLNVVAEFNGSGTLISRFVYGSRSNVPDYMVTADGTYRIISDQLGSVRRVVNASTGELKQRLEYDAWGQVLMDTSPGFQPFGYAGGLYDPDTKLVRFGARDYDASVGRWTAKDARVDALAAGSLYGYCKDDPVNRLDPRGLHWEYSQKSGDLTYVDDKTGQRTWVGKGYSGHGEGLNNPSKVDVRDVGPIPQGWWTIGPPFAGAQGNPEFHLTPNSDTVIPPGRNPTSFYIHADNAAQNFTASKGCPVLGRTPDIRLRIKRSHDRRLEVVP